jgi:hypothetical protein
VRICQKHPPWGSPGFDPGLFDFHLFEVMAALRPRKALDRVAAGDL